MELERNLVGIALYENRDVYGICRINTIADTYGIKPDTILMTHSDKARLLSSSGVFNSNPDYMFDPNPRLMGMEIKSSSLMDDWTIYLYNSKTGLAVKGKPAGILILKSKA